MTRPGWPEVVPRGLREAVGGYPAQANGPSGLAWLERLPVLVEQACDRWGLRITGAARHGRTALVLPVTRADGSPAALKVSWPHEEARSEHLALRAWLGRRAVRLLAADPASWTLLLERLDPGRDLDSLAPVDASGVVGDLVDALDRPALPQLDRLSAHLAQLAEDARRWLSPGAARAGVPRRLLDQARVLATDLSGHARVDARLVHTDLHGENVLWRAHPGVWVAIDPKPMAALKELAVAPVLWNRWPEAARSGDTRRHLRGRFDAVCEHAGLDRDLARDCTVLRVVRNALWALEAPGPGTSTEVTVAVTVAKAVQTA